MFSTPAATRPCWVQSSSPIEVRTRISPNRAINWGARIAIKRDLEHVRPGAKVWWFARQKHFRPPMLERSKDNQWLLAILESRSNRRWTGWATSNSMSELPLPMAWKAIDFSNFGHLYSFWLNRLIQTRSKTCSLQKLFVKEFPEKTIRSRLLVKITMISSTWAIH